jgi:hypothetical protein
VATNVVMTEIFSPLLSAKMKKKKKKGKKSPTRQFWTIASPTAVDFSARHLIVMFAIAR